jgi:hypothetical protein
MSSGFCISQQPQLLGNPTTVFGHIFVIIKLQGPPVSDG